MSAKIQLLRDTQTGWNSVNPVLAAGEIGLETNNNRFKVGDGTSQWGALTYFVDDANISTRLDGKANTSHTQNFSTIITTVTDKAEAYTILAADENTFIRSTSATAVTMTIANVLAIGESVQYIQFGAGQITFAAGAGVTLRSVDNKLKTNKQYSVAAITCVASGEYLVTGDLVA
jgi:hypothetical protein